MTMPSSGIASTSSANDLDFGQSFDRLSHAARERTRSTASAEPAGTRCASALRMISESSRRISALSKPAGAVQGISCGTNWSTRARRGHRSRALRCGATAASRTVRRRSPGARAATPLRVPAKPAADDRDQLSWTARDLPPCPLRGASHGHEYGRGLYRGASCAIATSASSSTLLLESHPSLAAPHGAGALGGLLDQNRRFALRARRRQRPVPGRELAVGIAVAAVEDLAAARFALFNVRLPCTRGT